MSTSSIPTPSTERGENPTLVTPDALRELLVARRSTRRFLTDEIPEGTLRDLCVAASQTPSGGAARAYEMTLLGRGPARVGIMRELQRIYARRSALLNSGLLRAVAAPFAGTYFRAFLRDREYGGRIARLLEQLRRGEDPVFYSAPIVVFFHSRALIPTPKEDCVIAAFAMSLAAQTAGLGCCFVTLAQSAVNTSGACKRLLGIDPDSSVHAVLLLGRPAVQAERREARALLPVHEV